MKYKSLVIAALIIFGFMLCVSGSAMAQDDSGVKIIANKDVKVDEVDAKFLSKLYLGKTKKWSDGTKAVAVVFKDDSVHEKFLNTYVKKSVSKFANHWKKLIFTGRGIPPKEFKTSQEVIEFVKTTPGSVAYVSSSVEDSEIKTISVK